MIIFGSHVGPHIVNIADFEVYAGIWKYMEPSELVFNKFAKSPSSRAGIPRFGFLVTNSLIKESAQE